jgi:hypothetical protein
LLFAFISKTFGSIGFDGRGVKSVGHVNEHLLGYLRGLGGRSLFFRGVTLPPWNPIDASVVACVVASLESLMQMLNNHYLVYEYNNDNLEIFILRMIPDSSMFLRVSCGNKSLHRTFSDHFPARRQHSLSPTPHCHSFFEAITVHKRRYGK